KLLPSRQANLDLYKRLLEVNAKGNNSAASPTLQLLLELAELPLVQEQLSGTIGIVIGESAKGVFRDVCVIKNWCVPIDTHNCVVDLVLSQADGLALRAGQLGAGLIRLVYEEVFVGPRVADLPKAFFFLIGQGLSKASPQ